ncbi:uncharacterized protein [Cicer arietinum]|uniref:uncharacterized protein isoform X2 n=1 Tax=Cicer arietinum TaxID=3827 RepID=UPI003CC53A0F
MVPSPSSENRKKMKTTTSSPLRRSERTRNLSSSTSTTSNHSPSTSSRTSISKRHVSVKKLAFDGEENDAGTSSNLKVKKMDARTYRSTLTKQKTKDSQKESNSMNRSTPKSSHIGGEKIDECFEGNSLHCKEVCKDSILPSEDSKDADMRAESSSRGTVKEMLENNATISSTVVPSNSTTHKTGGTPERVQPDSHVEETSQMLPSRKADSGENLIRKCVGNDKGENLTPSKRKNTVVDKHSDASATLVGDDDCNLIVDADSTKLCCNVVETSGPSKRIRGINNVDQPTSKSNDEKSCARNKEGKSGNSVEGPQGNNVETDKIRKQQRSLHLSLKPEIAKLCEILLLPDNVKIMVGNFLEYTMNNYKICTEPVSILQAFQLSLCCTASSLLRHKLDTEASLILAKRHLNFDCKKEAIDEINARLWDLKDNFLLVTRKFNVVGSPKASEPSNRVHSNTDITPDVELTKSDISGNIKESRKRKNQWRMLLHNQQENKHKLEKDIETEKADFIKRYKIEWASIKTYSVKRKEKLNVFKSIYDKRFAELRRQHEVRLQALETNQLEAQHKFRESSAPDELLNIVSLKEHVTPLNASKILLSDEVSEISLKRATASEFSREAAVGLPQTIKSTDYPENEAPLSSSSTDQISDEGLDGVVSSRPCSSSSPSKVPATISLSNSPSSTQQVPDRILPTITDGQIPVMVPELSREAAVELPTTVRSTDYPENAAPLNSLPTDQIADGGLDGVVSSRPFISSSPRNGSPATFSLLNSPSSTQQVPDRVLATITDGQIPAMVPENSHEETACQLIDNLILNESTSSECRTVTENTLSQETSECRPVDSIEPLEQVPMQLVSSVESPPSLVHILPANQSNHISKVMEPPEQVQQLASSGFLSSNQDLSNLPSATGVEDQEATNEDLSSKIPEASTEVLNEDLSSKIPETSTEVQNQAVEQPALDLEVDSQSRQVMPPVSNVVLDSSVPGGVRDPSSDTRNLSTNSVINNRPIQAAAQSASRNVPPMHHAASRNVPPLCHDPLSHELERIRKMTEQNLKNHENMKLQLKCNFEKEVEELRRKYDNQLKLIDVEFQKARTNYDTQFHTVYMHKILADALKANSDPKLFGASGMQGFIQLASQHSRQQHATLPSLVATPSSRGPPAATLQNSHATTGAHTMAPPPIQATTNKTSGTFSRFSARLPPINSIHSPSGYLQTVREIRAPAPHLQNCRPSTSLPASSLGGEIRSPAPHIQPYRPSTSQPPHIQPYRPSTSQPPSSLGGVPHGLPSQPAPSNSPASSVSLSQWLLRPMQTPMPAISQFDAHRGYGHEKTSGFPTPNLSALNMRVNANSQSSINLPNTRPHMSDLASLNHSQFGTSSMPANSSREAIPSDVVCLSDDD